MIPFNKPFTPPSGEFEAYISDIWARGWFTNNGPLVQELEQKLRAHLGLRNLLLTTNGTVSLQLAIRALDLKGDIITTPFSYVATTSSIVWQGCRPVFADIDPDTFNIDPECIEDRITPATTAILATHVFGNPCDVAAIENIAKRHGLKVIYDAAHCFGTTMRGKSIFGWGDISTTSFHATKLFQTAEGGAVMAHNKALNARLDLMRNFGHVDYGEFRSVGINGKNSELHAAMGLCCLKYADEILATRKQQYNRYLKLLKGLDVRLQKPLPDSEPNGSYFAIAFHSEKDMLLRKKRLEDAGIFPRRYFYPELSSLDYVEKQDTPIARKLARTVLCLPMYHTLTDCEQARIADILLGKRVKAVNGIGESCNV